MGPPSIKVITPNGRFKPGENICTSFTNFHKESWQISWTIEKMLIAMVSFMHDTEGSTGVVESSDMEKRRLAKISVTWNIKNNNDFVKIFKFHCKKLQIDPE